MRPVLWLSGRAELPRQHRQPLERHDPRPRDVQEPGPLPGTGAVCPRAHRLDRSGSALLVPDASVLADQSAHVVLTVSDKNVVVPKPVELGDLRGGLRVVRSGLTAADKVIVDGIPMARPARSSSRASSRPRSPGTRTRSSEIAAAADTRLPDANQSRGIPEPQQDG